MLHTLLIALLLGGVPAAALARDNAVKLDLISPVVAVAPGETVTLALRQSIAPEWHTYWSNPGEAGEPLALAWTAGAAGNAAFAFPVPGIIRTGPIVSYGYGGQAVLLTDVTVPADAAGSVSFAGQARWLACKDICVPEQATVSLQLPVRAIGEPVQPGPGAAIIATARAALPALPPGEMRFSADAGTVRLRVAGLGNPGPQPVRFFPAMGEVIADAADQTVNADGDALTLTLARAEAAPPAPARLEGILTIGEGEARQAFTIAALPGDVPSAAAASPAGASGNASATADSADGGIGLAAALGFALLGGLILNLMPCVLPVLSLKALSFAGGGDHRAGGLSYLAGVMATFLGLAALLLALRAGGATLGWGFQFQSPGFVLAMAALFLALGLWLSGVFELGGSVIGAGDALTRRSGNTGAFFTGALAALAATPCTAPFMGAAVGYALAQPPVVAFAVLGALGLGFGLPVTALAFSPGLARRLPRPGAWMETFRQALAFPLYATVAWLVWVLAAQAGADGVAAAGAVLLGIALAGWALGRRGSGMRLRGVAAAIALALALSGATLLQGAEPGPASAENRSGTLTWQSFSPEALAAADRAGRPVFLNLTAAWCITCKVNERVALSSTAVAEAFAAAGVIPMKGDWTRADPTISALLKAFGRAGVPLYVLYVPGAKPEVLPQVLTEGLIRARLAALPRATQPAGTASLTSP